MDSIINGAFKNKSVLITGGCGFIGSHLIKRLLSEGAKVSTIDRNLLNTWRIESEKDKIQRFNADISDTISISNIVKSLNPDYVYHLAAYGVDSAKTDYLTAAQVNIIGLINLINALRSTDCKKLINVGSCAEYGDRKEVMHETLCPCPVSIYGSTKASATIIAHQIAAENNISIATIRPFGIFGEGEERHKFFCHVILSILCNKDVNLTHCKQRRDYCYVENIIDGFLMAAVDKNIKNEIFNIGNGVTYPLEYYVNLIFKNIVTDKTPNYGAVPYRKNEMWDPVPDVSKIQTMLNWKPRITIEDGIINTINWFRMNKHLYK